MRLVFSKTLHAHANGFWMGEQDEQGEDNTPVRVSHEGG